MSEHTAHTESLMKVVVDQVRFAMADCLRHAAADMKFTPDHSAHTIILDELKSRIKAAVDEYE